MTKAMQGIQFENGKATIKPTSYAILDEVAKVFVENPTYVIEVQGHTDNVGNYQYNVDLSEFLPEAIIPDFQRRIHEKRQGGNSK